MQCPLSKDQEPGRRDPSSGPLGSHCVTPNSLPCPLVGSFSLFVGEQRHEGRMKRQGLVSALASSLEVRVAWSPHANCSHPDSTKMPSLPLGSQPRWWKSRVSKKSGSQRHPCLPRSLHTLHNSQDIEAISASTDRCIKITWYNAILLSFKRRKLCHGWHRDGPGGRYPESIKPIIEAYILTSIT